MRPLEGIRVLDFSTLLPGAMASLMLGEAGAQVIKVVHRAEGRAGGHRPPPLSAAAAEIGPLDRGKESLVVDLIAADATRILTPHIEAADVLIENFRPGDMQALGLDYETVRAINPRVVYCAITGWGQVGPLANVEARGLNCWAETGMMLLGRLASHGGAVALGPIGDIAAGAFPAVINILLALRQRERTGRGALLDVAIADAMFTFQYWAIGEPLANGGSPDSVRHLLAGGSPRHQIYETADGKCIALAAIEERHWENLCERLELEEELRGGDADPEVTRAALAAIFKARTAKFWREKFENRDVCLSIVATLGEALANPHFRDRGLFRQRAAEGNGKAWATVVPVAPEFRGLAPVSGMGEPAAGES